LDGKVREKYQQMQSDFKKANCGREEHDHVTLGPRHQCFSYLQVKKYKLTRRIAKVSRDLMLCKFG